MRFLALVVFIATVAGITSLNVEKVDSDTKKMNQCNQKVKKAFLQGEKKGWSPQDIYCSSMKELSKCIETQIKHAGNQDKTSDELRKYYFVVIAYLQMDKLMSVCAEDMTNTFKDKVIAEFKLVPEFQNFKTFRRLAFEENPADVVDECARKTHNNCITKFTKEEGTNQSDLCGGVNKFINCYQDNQCHSNPLSVSFASLIKAMSTELINAFENHEMCGVDEKTEL